YGGLLRCLCTCRAMDRLRQRARLSGQEEGLADWSNVASANPGPVEEAQAAELSQRLRLALARLPSQEAEVFCLRCLSELSYRDIGRQLGLKTSAVGVLLHRARSRLRELLSGSIGSSEAEI
ncbi:MAG: sigma-70 family RNA polymerase sigma factor, partial [Phycisphaerae bacterium]|nr:sigma-70 family RNA polymerase sigma factor [Phycisphaerae bacterium]